MNYTLITGACVNTGVAIVKKFLSEGKNVVFTGRNENKVLEAERKYKSEFCDADVIGYTIDSLLDRKTVDEKAIEELFDFLDEKDIFIDTLVLNAADQGLDVVPLESPIEDFMRVINTNMVWNYCISEYAVKRMREKGGGNIVFVNSNTAYRAIPGRVAYSASKSGQLGMMRAMALEFGKYSIRVNAVLPGMIKTDRWEKNPEFYENVPSRFTPIGDVAVGEDIADAVWYFAANARNTTGAELVVDGGNTIQLYPVCDNR
ncbi:MAG: SDR family oxidoreductase [Ruminococcaceae bacterium]|nr:SDR family oxidoreductase [Oscillospiraceae bacterium]